MMNCNDKVTISLTQQEWKSSLAAMNELMEQLQKQETTIAGIRDNVLKLNAIIFSKRSNVTLSNTSDNLVTKLTDSDFNSIMEEINHESDHKSHVC